MDKNVFEQKYIIGWSKQPDILATTSSGGMFRVFAEYVIDNGGWVFGTEFDREDLARVVGYKDERIKRFSGSKYVKSKLGDSFKEIQKYLEEGALVLFGGTPCQCGALRSFLKKDYDNLLLVDIICHGSPKPAVFSAYLDYVEKKQGAKVVDIKFRNKDKGWKNGQIEIDFENGDVIKEAFHPKVNKYANVFYSNIALTPGCGNCKYNTLDRTGDITLGDFWGYKSYPEMEICEEGTSVALVNTQKGNDLLEACEDKMVIKEVEKKVATSNNPPLHEHTPINPLSNMFDKCLRKYGFGFAYLVCLKVLKVLVLPVRVVKKIVRKFKK